MRSSGSLAIAALIAVSCSAQQSARPSPGYTGFGASGFGVPFATAHRGTGPGRVNGPGRSAYPRRTVIAPIYFGVPVYGGYDYGQDYADAPPSDAPPVQAAPTVIINQNFVPDHANPVVREVPDTADSGQDVGVFQAPGPPPVEPAEETAPAISDQPTIYLIAFQDHSIVPALAYWTEGTLLKYVNMDHSINQASLELVDRDMSRLLNDQRSVDFHLPAR
jgi:hypothetical protein